LFSSTITELFIKDSAYTGLIIISSFGILIALLYSFFSSVFQGLQDFKSYFIYNILLSVLKISVIAIFFFFVGFNLTNVVIILVFIPVFSVISSFYFLKPYRVSPLLYNRSIQKETFSFGKWMLLWSIAAILQSRVSTYLLASMMNVTEVSYYDLAKKFSNIVMFGFGAFGTVLNSKLAGITDRAELRKFVNKLKLVILGLTVILIISSILFPLFLNFLYGEKYSGAFIPMGIIMLSLIGYVWTLPYNSGLYSLGKSNIFFIQALAGLVIETTISVILIPKFGAVGASVSFGITYAIVLIISIFYFRKYINEKPQITQVNE
jgi:O-antigen/teichoic acid export membrane protein